MYMSSQFPGNRPGCLQTSRETPGLRQTHLLTWRQNNLHSPPRATPWLRSPVVQFLWAQRRWGQQPPISGEPAEVCSGLGLGFRRFSTHIGFTVYLVPPVHPCRPPGFSIIIRPHKRHHAICGDCSRKASIVPINGKEPPNQVARLCCALHVSVAPQPGPSPRRLVPHVRPNSTPRVFVSCSRDRELHARIAKKLDNMRSHTDLVRPRVPRIRPRRWIQMSQPIHRGSLQPSLCRCPPA